jgi:hypothetical protein
MHQLSKWRDAMNQRDEQKIRSVEQWPRHAGKNDYLKYLKGERLTQREAIKAKCFDCCCGEPGTCSVMHCPLVPFNQMIHKAGLSATPSVATYSNLLPKV